MPAQYTLYCMNATYSLVAVWALGHGEYKFVDIMR